MTQLVQTPDGFWAELAPAACANGHPYRGRRVLVSWHPCNCAGNDGHRTRTCLECHDVYYDPPHTRGSWESTGQLD
jgi:hypothetical protein